MIASQNRAGIDVTQEMIEAGTKALTPFADELEGWESLRVEEISRVMWRCSRLGREENR